MLDSLTFQQILVDVFIQEQSYIVQITILDQFVLATL